MVTNDATLLRIKHQVLYEVAKMAWEGRLEQHREEIPYKMLPGPKAQFRCCIYREREIIRERVRLAEGLCPSGKDTKNIVQVISSACEGCPIARYVVTDNCQKCMGKACQNSCNFGAISMGHDRAYIDPEKCKECGKYYTINPKQHTYPEETRKQALKMYYGGISGRSVGKILHMNKFNVMN